MTSAGGSRFTSASTPGARSSSPWDSDAEIGRLIALELGDEVREAPMVLEGGSVQSTATARS